MERAATAQGSEPEVAARTRTLPKSRYVAVVIGNPNTGKTTLFNALTGLTQHTGNYPGVTIEGALGELRVDGTSMLAVDLPGAYSLAPRAPDEMLAVTVLLGQANGAQRPDVVLCVLDATNLERNLYLLSQVIDLGLPVVAALTMVDIARRRGLRIDADGLGQRLGIPIVPVQANRRLGITELQRALLRAAREARIPGRQLAFPPAFDREVDALEFSLPRNGGSSRPPRFLVERLLIDASGFVEEQLATDLGEPVRAQAHAARARLAAAGAPVPHVETDARYAWIAGVVNTHVQQTAAPARDWTEWIDAVVTHKVWGVLVFMAAMALTFQAIFSWATPVMTGIDALFQHAGAAAGAALPPGALRSLVVNGVIGGVGAVVAFVPQIAILFGLITILEDSGYMARAAFLMDRAMASFGLSGRSFIPLLSSFACAVPGIMSARTIESHRDRIATILVAPLMSCSARLPVYVLFIAAFIPARTVGGVLGLQGLTLFAMYLIGMLLAPPVAFILKRTVLSGPPVPFLLELPPYKVPSWRVVLFRMYDRSRAFVRRAGTIILAATVLVWALSYYPAHDRVAAEYMPLRAAATSAAEIERLDAEEAGATLRQSFLGRAGALIEPAVRPLGWDWKIGMAAIASFPAREVVISALGTIYNLGNGHQGEGIALRQAMRAERWPNGRPVYTPLVALSVMVFFALCCQCAATLATIRRETNSWGYALLTFTYMTTLAYLGALCVYQIGSRLAGA